MTGSTRFSENISRTGLRLNLSSLPGPSDENASSATSSRKHILAFNASPGEKIDPNITLDQQGWYHGSVSRSDAETILRLLPEGSFLVRSVSDRVSRRGTIYSLCLKSAKGFMHMKITSNQDSGQYLLGLYSPDYSKMASFSSIPELIHFYSRHQLPIKGAEHMTLKFPVIYQLL